MNWVDRSHTVKGVQTKSLVAEHCALSYVSAGHDVAHDVQLRSDVNVHGCDSNSVTVHVVRHAEHTASDIAVHEAEAY